MGADKLNLPWRLETIGPPGFGRTAIVDRNGEPVQADQAMLEFAVAAANNHHDLVDAASAKISEAIGPVPAAFEKPVEIRWTGGAQKRLAQVSKTLTVNQVNAVCKRAEELAPVFPSNRVWVAKGDVEQAAQEILNKAEKEG